MRLIRQLAGLLLLSMSGLTSISVQADTLAPGRMFDSVAVYAGQGVNHNLNELPDRIATGRLNWDRTYFAALGLGKIRGTLDQSFDSLQDTPLGSFQHGYEMVLVQHRGLQSDTELGAAYTLRTSAVQIGSLGVSLMAGAGLSYAFGNPSYEDGSRLDPGRRYHLQFLGLLGLEWRMRGFDNVSVHTRIHHRSGMYGLIAPQHVGSNFLALGVCYKY